MTRRIVASFNPPINARARAFGVVLAAAAATLATPGARHHRLDLIGDILEVSSPLYALPHTQEFFLGEGELLLVFSVSRL